ncbi:MAG: substrate-binding domain-containing protein [Spirochaetes bacterium]|nr:substrate-binding domain-containing protein [Spirochaetota bacterium]
MKLAKPLLLFCLFFLISIFNSCKDRNSEILKLATTTSTADTGLLDYLLPIIEEDTGIEVQYIAVGTGKALEYGRNCDVDALMVHAPDAEKKFINDGYGIERKLIMYNDFIIIGPESDPAGLKGKSVRQAFGIIAVKRASFVSRGDNSGTHKKETGLWKSAGLKVPDKQKWYIQSGQGMMNTITIAEERSAYTMADRGTYIKYADIRKGKQSLVIIVEGDPDLRNQYSVMAINPERCDNVKYETAKKFSEWIISPKAQKAIGDFKLMGKQLFIPNAGTGN